MVKFPKERKYVYAVGYLVALAHINFFVLFKIFKVKSKKQFHIVLMAGFIMFFAEISAIMMLYRKTVIIEAEFFLLALFAAFIILFWGRSYIPYWESSEKDAEEKTAQ